MLMLGLEDECCTRSPCDPTPPDLGCRARWHQTGILDFMDQYAKIDHATLVRNLNAVCKELGWLVNGTALPGGPPSLTYSDTGICNSSCSLSHRSGGWVDQ